MNSIKFCKQVFGCSLALVLLYCVQGCSAVKKSPLQYEDGDIFMRLVIRTNEQLAAFYTGREFPKSAIEEILNTCFITPLVKNKNYEALWVEPESWQFSINDEPITRIKRDYWKKVWKKTGLSLAHQSTFGWTLMPETRDLRLDEGVGGSVVIPRQSEPFNLEARLVTGLNKQGPVKVISFRNITCAE